MWTLDDTIAAISTPIGEGGIGIVRLSGPEAEAILRKVFRPRGKKRQSSRPFEPKSHYLYYGHVVDPGTGIVVDEVLATLMRAPRTYTRQDVAEIYCHGGIVPLRRTLELVLRHGARLAQPGEFTLRAFLNGRIDLAQAEAVLDIVRAKTEVSLRVAMEQLDGRISGQVRVIRSMLLTALAHLEASLDFPEDEIPPLDLASILTQAKEQIQALLTQAAQGMIYRHGVRTAIIGRPNVGKSSLLNALLRTSRAIVTPIPGTTRDTLEETLNLRGIPLCLVDTAGITKSTNLIEKLGIERSLQALQQADLVLFVIDGSEPLQEEDFELATAVRNKSVIVVVNKLDLPAVADADSLLPEARHVHLSALTGEGLNVLEDTIVETVFSGQVQTSDVPIISNPRHREILHRALAHITAAESSYQAQCTADLTAIDLTAAVSALGEITGESVSEDVLELIFSNFCLGK
ncbi:MAG: tRNA uridine-5-carboxymethylaminomethyl(34) synthesis GTPase MnmE [Chloroflexi bacterium]|nr:tRNA uridine-5-carboxymethylaminomethyl(34) synthesis GTPase MnmE [Chloroflexota bacterium]